MTSNSTASALARPKANITDVSSTLRDFAITTWDVSPDKLQSFLPSGITADEFEFSDGRKRAFVSAVTFLNTRFFVHFAPFVKLQCQQTNYRAYVRRGSERAVWFFGTTLASRFVYLPRIAWQLPWHYAEASRNSEWNGNALKTLQWSADAPGAIERLRLKGTGNPLGKLQGFSSFEQTHQVLAHPLVGYLRRRDGHIATYGVWHLLLELEQAEVQEARFEMYEQLGLIEPHAPPHSVLVQRETEFLVRLPPRRVRDL